MTRRARAAVALTSVLAAFAGHASDCAALATGRAPARSHHGRGARARRKLDVPAFCRVQGEARPTADSQIGFEVWLPRPDWNGRYYQLGSGGFAGSIHHPSLAAELRRGNAVAATDTGHRADCLRCVMGARPSREDRRLRLSLAHARRACCEGARACLLRHTRLASDTSLAARTAVGRRSWRHSVSRRIGTAFSPVRPRSPGPDSSRRSHGCSTRFAPCRLTQLCASFVKGLVTRESGEQLYFGFAADPDSDSELQLTFAEQFFRNMVHDDPAWRIERLRRRARLRARATATHRQRNAQPGARRDRSRPVGVRAARGKLLMYFGWADALISPHAGVDYYERVVARMGGVERTHGVLPAVHGARAWGTARVGQHLTRSGRPRWCRACATIAEHDIRRALEAWVERGRAPERIVEAAQVLRPYKMGEQ